MLSISTSPFLPRAHHPSQWPPLRTSFSTPQSLLSLSRHYSEHHSQHHPHPKWRQPSGYHSGIVLYNSLSRCKVPLILQRRDRVGWYTCGPTVYDHAHLGHARNYLQVDVIIRILRRYFRFRVDHVMGMTDIDDKILNKALETNTTPSDLAQRFESDFWRDLDALGIARPTRVGRVTDHLHEITQFIQRMAQHGYTYHQNGSVYFDSARLGTWGDKLKVGSESLGHDSGDFQKDSLSSEKKSPKDFVLWKKSKFSEPGWGNPFSDCPGRPGWHIECSAIATHNLGSTIDIHAGGIDLKFPHHNNELNQSDAYFDDPDKTKSWVSYFLHTGHLHISGRKMSKSLKNFITIKEFLTQYHPLDFRFFCIQTHYSTNIDFSEDRMKDAQNLRQKFLQFYSTISQLKPEGPLEARWTPKEHTLHESFLSLTDQIDSAFRDDFDTPTVLKHLLDLTHLVYLYLQEDKPSPASLPAWPSTIQPYEPPPSRAHFFLVKSIWEYLDDILGVLGIHLEDSGDPLDTKELLEEFADFRGNVRKALLEKKDPKEIKKTILTYCDQVRDASFPRFGYSLQDRQGDQVPYSLTPLAAKPRE